VRASNATSCASRGTVLISTIAHRIVFVYTNLCAHCSVQARAQRDYARVQSLMCEAREGYAALKQVTSSTTRSITALQREQREKDRAIHAQFRHPKQVRNCKLSLFTEPFY
jgi:hypothetical protein